MGVHVILDRDADGNPLQNSNPFRSKKINGKKLFKRIHGLRSSCVIGLNTIDFVVPHNQVKITGLEFFNAEIGDYVEMEIIDTPTGTISGVPDYKLNQFGFTANIAKDYYEHKSEYDADLIKDLKIRVKYYSVSAKQIGINYILNELKT